MENRTHKERPEVGIQDIDKYEFGGLEIDNLDANGYQLYIPYGIHVDLFNAIERGARSLSREASELKALIQKIKEVEDSVDNEAERITYSQVREDNGYRLKKLEQPIHLLEKILPLINEI